MILYVFAINLMSNFVGFLFQLKIYSGGIMGVLTNGQEKTQQLEK